MTNKTPEKIAARRERNQQIAAYKVTVVELLRRCGPMSAREIARELGITTFTGDLNGKFYISPEYDRLLSALDYLEAPSRTTNRISVAVVPSAGPGDLEAYKLFLTNDARRLEDMGIISPPREIPPLSADDIDQMTRFRKSL